MSTDDTPTPPPRGASAVNDVTTPNITVTEHANRVFLHNKCDDQPSSAFQCKVHFPIYAVPPLRW